MRWAIPRVLGGMAVLALQLFAPSSLRAQGAAPGTGTVRGRVTEASGGRPISDAQVLVDGTTMRAMTNATGEFIIPSVPAGARTITARRIGFTPGNARVEVVAGQTAQVTVALNESASQIEGVVVTAFGETAAKRSQGTSTQVVSGSAVAETQRENFLNALQGRVAGVQVNSTSGVPGASSQITIRGVSSISSSNQPLFVIDGMPMDNKTLNSGVLASSFSGSTVSFENRGVDFTNRAADLNPEDIESITVLKGPEAAALYGIDAANGAIVITTRRGTSGGGLEYNNSFRVEKVRNAPSVQRVYGPRDSTNFGFTYWGPQYAEGTTFYDNVDGFFQSAMTQRHNLAFSGAAPDNRVNYRVTGATVRQEGVVPTTAYNRYNVTGAGQSQATKWLNVDLTTAYSYTDNHQPFKGYGSVTVGPLISLLAWPQTDQASNWLTPAGTRRRVTNNSNPASEIDNPYFAVEKNHITSTNNRILVNLGLRFTPFSWGNIKTQVGTDAYANHNEVLRHPESSYGAGNGGQLDVADDNTRNLSAQALLNVNRRTLLGRFSVQGLVGTSAQDNKSTVDALWGSQFLESEFVSINNTTVNRSKTTIAQRRLQSAFGQATFDYGNYLFLTVSGRNDWTSTIPVERNSFFYPSVSSSFIFTDAFPSLGKVMTGKLRAAYAEVGRDASPYAFRPSLQYKTTSYGGYGYDFWGPNFKLRPEFAHSYEFGTELGFFDDRLGLDATVYRKETQDQIVQNIRGTYATGFILFNLNGASTRNTGVELTARAMPLRRQDMTWEVIGNFDHSKGIVLALPNALPESYNSDTWLYGNVRNGNTPGMSTMSLTGNFYARNKKGQLLISPTSGLPVRVPGGTFVDRGYDRQPDFTLGLTNNLTYKKARVSMLWDFRKGGDVFNATEHLLTTLGLSKRTLDREKPRVVPGVLQDGLENTDHPTPNTIVLVPATTPGYYQSMSEELFIERNINWARLRDVTVSYMLPGRLGRTSVFVTGTDLLLFTNYSGLDPIVNGNSAAVGGSGAVGFDFGNFPIPRGFNFGLRTSF